MVHPTILKFYTLILSFQTQVVFELQNAHSPLELVTYSNFEREFQKEFSLNSMVGYFGLEKGAFIIFKAGGDWDKSYIAVDENGEIYRLIFEPGPIYRKVKLADDIFELIKTSKLSFQKLPKVYEIIKYEVPKFPIDEKFEFGYLQSIVKNSLQKTPSVSNIETSVVFNEETEIRLLNINFTLHQSNVKLSIDNTQFKEGSDSFSQFVNLINFELSKIDGGYKFACVHENGWDSLHALVLVDSVNYNKLENGELIVNY